MLSRALIAAIALVCAFAAPAIADDAPAAIYLDLGGGGHCSGFYAGGNKIVTAGHCVDRSLFDSVEGGVIKLSKTFTVLDDSFSDIGTTDKVIAYSAGDDVAVLALAEPLQLAPAAVDCSRVAIGQDISVIGYPGPLGYVTTFGKVAGTPRRFAIWNAIYVIDAKADGGNSGGPVLDTKTGKVVGILVGLTTPSHSIYSLVVPTPAVCAMLGTP
jgi:hypothetical protein